MVLVVRALYSYDGDHDSSLTFKADDLIQVFTQLDSGWWDGLLRDERGWFPSNYVSPPLIMRSRTEEKAWVKRTAADGQPFWYNEVTGESAWERKDNVILLPEGWTIQDTEDGQGQFFFHEETDEVSWTLPQAMWEQGYVRSAMVAPPPLKDDTASPTASSSAADGPRTEPNGTAPLPAPIAPTANGNGLPRDTKTNSLDTTSALRRGSGARTPTPAISEAAAHARTSAHTNGSMSDATRPGSSSTAPGTPPSAPATLPGDSTTPAPAPGNPLGSPTPSMGAASISSNAGPAERQMQAWSLLTQQIFAAIQRLLKSAKSGNKQAFIPNSSQIVDAIRAMLQASGAVDKESAAVKSNPPVKQQHRALLGALSKLVLSAKLASGVWPPPDAVQKMIGDSSELLSSVRGFVEVARQCNVEVKTDIIEQKAKEEKERAAEQSAATAAASAPQAAPAAEPLTSPTSNGPTRALSISLDSNTVNQLDTLSSSVLDTLSRLYATTQEHITVVTLVTLTRSAVTEVGQFLSFIEDIHLEEGPDSPLLHEFKIHKQSLYNNIAGLVMATSTATENLAPPNAMDQVVLSITVVERSVKDLLASTQQLLEAKYRREYRRSSMAAPAIPLSPVSPFPQQKPIAADRLQLNTELANSAAQRRAQSGPMSAYVGSTGLTSPPHTTASFASAPAGLRAGSMGSSPPQTPYSAKLRKFFGDDVDPSTLPPIPQAPRGMSGEMDADANAWFLGYDYAPNEIMFNMESQVKGGTLRALIERLTLHDQFDAEYTTAFLFSYRTFIPSTALVDSLMARFSIAPPEGLTDSELETWIEKKMTPVRLRVFNVMKMWVEHYCLPYIPDDLLALDQMCQWARTVMRPVMAPASVQLTKLIEKRQSFDKPHLPLRNVPPINGMTPIPPTGPPPSPLLPKSLKKLKFTDLDPLEVARQLTLIEYSYFTRLIYTEFLMKSWSADRGSAEEAKARAPNLRRMVEMSNSITGWVAESILAEEDPKKRCSLLKHYIQIADKCRSLNNYNTLFSILAALNSAPIHRLARTWEMLSTKTLGVLNDLRQITDPTKNFATYRELVASVQPPCIPFLGRYLSDLTFLEDGNPNVLKIPGQPAPGEEGASPDTPVLVNFSKRAKTADIIREIQQFQVLPFHLKPVTEIQEYLLGMINHNRESGELYEISLNREPREREDQKLVRLLSESGLL